MLQKEKELFDILKNLDQQLTSLKKCLQSGANVNNNVPNGKCNFLIWATNALKNEEILEYLINNGANVNDERDGFTPLIQAVHEKSLNKIKLLLSKGASVNNILSDGDTPLTTRPIDKTDLPIVQYLIEQGADVNLIGMHNRTALSWAVSDEKVEFVRLLIANGAIVNKPDGDGKTPLTIARKKGNKAILKLLENPTSHTQKSFTKAVTQNSLTGNELLLGSEATIKMIDSDEGNKPVLKTMDCEDNKPLLNAKDSEGDTPLLNAIDSEENTHLQNAIRSGKIEIVKRLLKDKVNVCKRGKNGKTPLLTAVETGNSDIVRILLENGAEFTIQSALFEAVRSKNLEIVKILIEKGAILDITCRDGCTPLTKSIETNDLDIVKVLVETGADVNMPRRDDTPPLALAIKIGNLEIVKYLINNSGQLKSDSTASFECLMKHMEDDNFGMVQVLVEIGAPLNSIYDEKDTPLTKAVKLENYEIVKYFVEQGADVNQTNAEGKVPLAIAASNHDIRIVMFLIRSKAHLDLAKKEIEEYVNVDDDIEMFMNLTTNESMRNLKCSFLDFGHDAADD